MKIGVLKENKQNEKRVALTPSIVKKIKNLGYDVSIERDAGDLSNFYNTAYEEAGAEIATIDDVLKSDILLKINKPTKDEISKLSGNQSLISFLVLQQTQTHFSYAQKTK